MNPKTEENQKIYRQKLNDICWNAFDFDCPQNIRNKFDFAKSPHLETIFFTHPEFDNSLKQLVKAVKKNSTKPVKIL